jgi:hypothetical protein
VALQLLLAGRDFLGTATRDASDRPVDLSFETTKTVMVLWNGVVPSFGVDQKDPFQIRSIRITPPT